MKVCHLVDHFGLGGAQRVIADLVETRGSDVQVQVIALRDRSLDLQVRRIEASGAIYETLSLSKWNPTGALRLRNAIASGRFDILHTHLEFSNTVGVVAAASLGRHRPRIVRHIHADPWTWNSAAFRVVVRATRRPVDAHVAPGPGVAARTAAMFKSEPIRVRCVRNGIDVDGFESATIDEARVVELRAGARRVLGFVGRLAEAKDPATVIDAMPALLAAEPSTRLLMVGEGPLEDALRKRCERLGISHAVTFTGYVENMAEVYRAIDVLALATLSEGLPVTIIEAMIMRVPVVASTITGVTDIVVEGSTGLLAAPSDPSAMATCVQRLFNDPGLSKSLQDNACEVARSTYSRRRMTCEIESLYAELMSERP